MLRKDIRFTNFNDEEVTGTYFFHLSKADLIRMEVEMPGGLSGYLTQIVEAKNDQALMSVIEKLILDSYGVKSEDGMRFIKNQEVRDSFAQTNAYSELLMELSTDEEAANQFIQGIVPHNLKADLAKIAAKQKAKEGRREATKEDALTWNIDPTLEGPASVVPPAPPAKVQRIITPTEAAHMDASELQHLIATGQAVFGN